MGRRRFTPAALTGDIDDLIGLNSIDQVHHHNANIEIGAEHIVTDNLIIRELAATQLTIRNALDNDYRDLFCRNVHPNGALNRYDAGTLYIQTRATITDDILYRAYDTAYRDVLRMINGNVILPPRTAPANHVEGALYYDSGDDQVKVSDGAAWHTLLQSLDTTEIADQAVAGGASITPTVDGIFSAVMNAEQMNIQIYSDTGAAWLTLPCSDPTVPNIGVSSVVGEASKIRFRNADGVAHDIVVNRIA